MDWSYIDTGCLVELSWTNKDAKVNRDRVTSNHDQLWTFTWTCLEFTQPCKEVLMDYLCESLALIFADQRETEKARIHLKSHGHCPGSSPNLCYHAFSKQLDSKHPVIRNGTTVNEISGCIFSLSVQSESIIVAIRWRKLRNPDLAEASSSHSCVMGDMRNHPACDECP